MHLLCGSSRAMKRAQWRLTAAKLHGTSPRGEQSSTEAVAEVQMDDRKKISWARKSQQRRVMKAEKSEEWMARSPV